MAHTFLSCDIRLLTHQRCNAVETVLPFGVPPLMIKNSRLHSSKTEEQLMVKCSFTLTAPNEPVWHGYCTIKIYKLTQRFTTAIIGAHATWYKHSTPTLVLSQVVGVAETRLQCSVCCCNRTTAYGMKACVGKVLLAVQLHSEMQ